MRVLITNNTLADRAGTELFVRDLALGLLKQGDEPIAYSTRLGEVAREIRDAGVRVVDDLKAIAEPPEIIHGHHHLDTMTALLHFPATPAIFVCHGSTPWEEAAPLFPRILRYVAVDHACRDRLLTDHAIRPERVQVILNFVDLERFKRRAELPPRPRRALIFSNRANELTHLPAVIRACQRARIPFDVVGLSAGKVSAAPESILANYDLVFAKGRSALEGLAIGAAVVLCDAAGVGPMVTTKNVQRLRPLNFGLRALSQTPDPEVIARAIEQYDSADAAEVCSFIRGTASRDAAVEKFRLLYQEVIDENKRIPAADLAAEYRGLADYLRELKPRLQTLEMLTAKAERLDRITNSRSWRLIGECLKLRRKLFDLSFPLRRLLLRPENRRAAQIEADSAPTERRYDETA